MKNILLKALVSSLVIGAEAGAQSVVGQNVDIPSDNGLNTRVTVDLKNTPLAQALRIIAQRANLKVALAEPVIAVKKNVTIQMRDVSVQSVLQNAIAGTGIAMTFSQTGQVMFTKYPVSQKNQGVITGKIIDAKTGKGIPGANVFIGGEARTITRGDGSYHLRNVSSGSYVVSVRSLGYAKQTRSVAVEEGSTVTVDFSLEPSANVLSQVIVTGSVVATELKAVPNAITVITAKQIEDRGITKIDQLFRGDVPGIFAQNWGSGAVLDEVTMFSRGTTALPAPDASFVTAMTNPIKTYVDGVELADPKYLSQLDPRSIERIEILTGPQASTVYGSNAINGVMQIFTKRGSRSTPQLGLNLLTGWVENNFSTSLTPQQDYNTQISGIEGRLSYNAGGSWNYVGPWTPGKRSARNGGFGGARLELPIRVGAVTADLTMRHSITQESVGGDRGQTATRHRETGWWTSTSSSGLSVPVIYILAGQTLGLTLTYTPVSWWSHELGLGQDASYFEARGTARGYTSIFDTTLNLTESRRIRRSQRYTTTTQLRVATPAQLTVTLGADAWQNLTSSMEVAPQALTGTLTGNNTKISRQPDHNGGGFLQTQFALVDRLFLTYGLRAEWNPAFGEEVTPNIAPRYGVAYTQDAETPLGGLTTKLRASYGRSTRPPMSKLKAAQTVTQLRKSSLVPFYGDFDYYLANTELAPEHQQGMEGGLELFLGNRASLIVTRYNQTVDGLIAAPKVDSIRSSDVCPPSTCAADSRDADGYGYSAQYRYVNLGSIRNQGWELQGTVNVGPWTTKGTYSWTKSRIIGITPKYRAYYANMPRYQPGSTFMYLPEHTWALDVTYAHAKTTISSNVSGIGRAFVLRDDFYIRNLDLNIRLRENRFKVGNVDQYINFNSAYATTNLLAAHRFSSRLEALLQIKNITDRYVNDYYAIYASMGRQTLLGLRVR